MVAMLGAVSMVIDAGVFFVIQRQLQTAADAAALAAVWYDPACPYFTPWGSYGCQPPNSSPPEPECAVAPNQNDAPCNAAADSVKANWSVALALCAGPKSATGTVQIAAGPGIPPSGSLNVPAVQPYVVTVTCNAPHWFAQVLPGVLPTMTISASASAALGWLGPNGQLLGGNTRPTLSTPLVARLLIPS
jgi:hypothetical protein